LIDISARYSDDAGHKKFTDEVYEHQYRLISGAQWQPKAVGWTDLVRIIRIKQSISYCSVGFFRLVIKFQVKMNEVNHQQDGHGKMNGLLMLIEL